MITPSWPDQSWFPEIRHLVTEPPMHFQPSQWLVCKALLKVMRSNQLTTWRLISPSVPRMAAENTLPGMSLTPGQ